MAHYTKDSEVSETREVPAICPLINKCAQHRADQQEYKSLCKKWTEHARSQADEELEITSTKKGKTTKEKYSVDYIQEVTGTQVFHLEYMNLEDKKKERFEQMCPHFKGDVLGLITSDPAYHDCRIFSEWFYNKERG
ncbi:hypothetical protein GH146_02810 [archaeon]|jgi:hypothetical protein|nr:hypothetical protein [archaeon]